MTRYKVIQDVEAEDKLLGPLTLRQFIYAFVAGVCLFLCYFVAAHGAPFMIAVFAPPAAVASFFAFPWSHEQSTEVWALARVRFLFKPRKRVWNQSGIKELVTITVPKHLELIYTDGLSQNEVKSRLRALADTIDSRGWAIKNITATPYAPAYASSSDDRLLSMANLPQEVPTVGAETFVDVLDPKDNNVARHFDDMLQQNAVAHHQQLVATLQQTPQMSPVGTPAQTSAHPDPSGQQPTPDYWFLNQTQPHDNTVATIVAPGSDQTATAIQPISDIPEEEEEELVETLRKQAPRPAFEYSHLPTILPLAEREKIAKEEAERAAANKLQAVQEATPKNASTSTMTDKHNAAILDLAGNDDLNIDTIAREAKKSQASDDEVVISLH